MKREMVFLSRRHAKKWSVGTRFVSNVATENPIRDEAEAWNVCSGNVVSLGSFKLLVCRQFRILLLTYFWVSYSPPLLLCWKQGRNFQFSVTIVKIYLV